jgi:uncharacterized membrane protein YbaN (DUF454 family)
LTLTPRKSGLIALWGWRMLGALSLALGAIGVVLPLLPTTPLVILAAFCFAKSAPALHARLVQSPTFGPAIADWQARGAIARRHKAMAVGMMTAAFGAALIWGVPVFVLVVQALCMGGAALFILTRPSD